MFENVADYIPYWQNGLNPSASYAAPQAFQHAVKHSDGSVTYEPGVSVEQGKLLLSLGFRRVTQNGAGPQKWWVGPELLQMGIWKLAPWPHAPVEDQQLPTT